jgi:hypothetical protein
MAAVPVEIWIGLVLVISAGILYVLVRWSRDRYVHKHATPEETAALVKPLPPPNTLTSKNDRRRERDELLEYLRTKYSPANLTILSFFPSITLCGAGMVLAWGVLKWAWRSIF